jgi:transposase
MQFLEGKDRSQIELFPQYLDQIVSADNEVRMIDAFVNSIKAEDFGFVIKQSFEGRPAYHPKDLLKLFVYGYLHRVRSSRQLEKECARNIEVMWLLKMLTPDHNTISNFRRDNADAIKKVFRYTVSIAKNFELIGGALVAGDSTKLRAQNSKKNNFNPKKLEKHIAYIDSKLEEYTHALKEADGNNNQTIDSEIAKHTKRKVKYQAMQKELEESGDTQISTSDPDSRQMITRNNITEVAYNIQTVVDEKNKLILDYKVTNQNDSKAMGSMLASTCEILETNEFVALYDKGYHTGSEFKTAAELGVDVMVAIPDVASNAPDKNYNVEHFTYNYKNDTYTCPQGQILTTTGTWHNKDRGKSINRMKQYRTIECKECPVRNQCTRNPKGRIIERTEHAQHIEHNKKNIEAYDEIYKMRQAIVEHPYGTIKRQWGFCHIMTKRFIHRASADVGLIFVAYNFRRLLNILDQKVFKAFLEMLNFYFPLKSISTKVYNSIFSHSKSRLKLLKINFVPRSYHSQMSYY